ncbi:MAG: DUF4159 domain-containing protein, partial [Gammaproteobacteria bacterium]
SISCSMVYSLMLTSRSMTPTAGLLLPGNVWDQIIAVNVVLLFTSNFNMDLGDAWEHADVPQYALRYTKRAYEHAINYIVYAMTH